MVQDDHSISSLSLSFILSFSKLRDHKLLSHSSMVNPTKMEQKIKSNKLVPVGEGALENWGKQVKENDGKAAEPEKLENWGKEGKEGKVSLEDLVMDDEFENFPVELLPGDYEEGWGEEFYDQEFDKQLRG